MNGVVANGAVANGVVVNGAVANGVVASGAVANGAVANGAVANGVVPHFSSQLIDHVDVVAQSILQQHATQPTTLSLTLPQHATLSLMLYPKLSLKLSQHATL